MDHWITAEMDLALECPAIKSLMGERRRSVLTSNLVLQSDLRITTGAYKNWSQIQTYLMNLFIYSCSDFQK